jgi:hypothetical protein
VCCDILEEKVRKMVMSQYDQGKLWLTQGIIINEKYIHHLREFP